MARLGGLTVQITSRLRQAGAKGCTKELWAGLHQKADPSAFKATSEVGRLNHVAIAVPDLQQAAERYRTVLGAKVSDVQEVPEHGVSVVFVELANTKLELLHPLGDNSPISKFLQKNPSGGLHHLCLEVADIKASMSHIASTGVRCLDSKPKIGAHGNPVVFLHPKDNDGVLTELEQVPIKELKDLTLLRIDDSAKHLFQKDLTALQANVRALEQKLQEIRTLVRREKEAIPKVQADGAAKENRCSNAEPAGEHADCGADKRKRSAPRRYITQDELASLSSYMRQRLTLEKVNAAVDEAAAHAEAMAKLLAGVRNSAKMPAAERKRGQMLLVNVASKEGVKGRHWFMEGDLKNGTTLKMDKTGKSILTVLRHLGRMQEARFTLEGTVQLVYILQ
ncbi:hypothetical protein WJX72_006936 [[Myrmecia] bisecta]|uniref:Methylmalonyl-CoA epimerase, mitochondrial n=1 Tax=[Myrmecia] bisecta TaxID=41462 RepID=A0AAW1Q3V8_9CHLO